MRDFKRRQEFLRTTALLGALLASALTSPATAAGGQTYRFDIPAEPLSQALQDFGQTAGKQLIFVDGVVAGRMAPAVNAQVSAEVALSQLLADADLTWRTTPTGAIMILRRDGSGPQRVPAAAAGAQAPDVLNEVIVTGTRIAGVAPVGSRAIILDRDDLAKAGRGGASDLLRTLPENFSLGAGEEARGSIQASPNNLLFGTGANLRGLGVDATLTLVNGHRVAQTNLGGFVDLSQIPMAAIERVEVLADGASALYGSDAVGGVVNFVLRKRFDGAESTVRAGGGRGFDEEIVSQAFGRSWKTGRAFLAVEYQNRSNLDAAKRSFFTDDLRAFGGPDLRAGNSSPGTLVANGVSYAIPAGQNGVGLTASQLTAGAANLSNRWEDTDILPSIHRLSAAGTVSQELTDDVRLFGDLLVSHRESVKRTSASTASLVVPRSNPFFVSPVAGAASVNVLYSYIGDLGAIAPGGRSDDLSLSGGAEVRLPGDWRATISGLTSRNRVDYHYRETVNSTALALALADPNPATAFNPFGDAGSNSAAVVDRIRGFYRSNSRGRYDSANLDASGVIGQAPGGPLRLALGAEHHQETLRTWDQRLSVGVAPTLTQGALQRRVDAAYGELLAPLMSEANRRPGLYALNLSAAVRGERYSDNGRTVNPKFGFNWRPISDLQIEGSWGTSFKAPSLYQQDPSSNVISTVTYVNPGFAGGRTTVIQLSGTHKDLRPETARTWSIGFEYQPSWLPGFRTHVTYFDVAYKNRILRATTAEIVAALQTPQSPLILDRSLTEAKVVAYYADPQFAPTSLKPAFSQISAVVDVRQANLGRVEQSGLDFGASYGFDPGLGHVTLSTNFVYLNRYAVARQANQPAVDRRNTIGNPVDLHGNARIAWSGAAWDAGLTAQYVNGYRNTMVGPAQKVAPWTTLDAHLGYRPQIVWARGVQVALDIRNLGDAAPPPVANTSGPFGYDPEEANALGRVTSMTVTKRW
jgi:iron complex outermembrane receptor protein